MCVVSAIGNDYSKRLPEKYPNQPWDTHPTSWPSFPNDPFDDPFTGPPVSYPNITISPLPTDAEKIKELQDQIAELKKDMEEVKKVLLVAKKYDEDNNEPHCEMDEKVALLKKVAAFVGVDLSEVFDIIGK